MKTTKNSIKRLFKTEMYKRFDNERKVKATGTERHPAILPEVGMGATTGAGSDAYPHTIIEVAPDYSYIVIQSDKSTPTKDYDYYANQKHTFSPDPNGAIEKYTLRKTGRYIQDGAPLKAYYCGVTIGYRRKYSDPSF